jgi:hypothetical protein
MTDSLFAKYDPAKGIFWKGTRPGGFVYMTREDAQALLATLEYSETKRRWSRTEGGVERWQAMVGDLSAAIAAHDEDQMEFEFDPAGAPF